MNNRWLVAVDLDNTMLGFTKAARSVFQPVIAKMGFNSKIGNPSAYHLYEIFPGLPSTVGISLLYKGLASVFEAQTPIEGAREVLKELKSYGFRFIAMTGREADREYSRLDGSTIMGSDVTSSQLAQWFPGLFDGLVMTTNKAQACKDLGAIALIDDELQYLTPCVDAGIVPVCLAYCYNEEAADMDGVKRVDGWSDIRGCLLSLLDNVVVGAR